jgi:hypothetical protein
MSMVLSSEEMGVVNQIVMEKKALGSEGSQRAEEEFYQLAESGFTVKQKDLLAILQRENRKKHGQ